MMILLEDVLRQRLLPPRLATSGTSSRTALTEPRNGRMYPPPERVEAWEDFHDGVLSFTCNGNLPILPFLPHQNTIARIWAGTSF
jgi:hypothetical protein